MPREECVPPGAFRLPAFGSVVLFSRLKRLGQESFLALSRAITFLTSSMNAVMSLNWR